MDFPDDTPDDKSAGLLAEVAPGDNSPPLTVSELSGALKRTIETAFDKMAVALEQGSQDIKRSQQNIEAATR